MSIAVSADITPSPLLRLALSGYAAACLGAAIALAFDGGRFHGAPLLAASCLLAALAAAAAAGRRATMRRIDISGLGEIRLTVQQSMGETAPRELVQLMPGSTVWPSLLLLLLRDSGNGVLTALVILPDSVAHEQFRKIAVSIRAIARRDKLFLEKNKIH